MSSTNCNSCKGIRKITPQSIHNRAGLTEIGYRVGTHAGFLETMKSAIANLNLSDPNASNPRPLEQLTSREGNDPAIAILDSWALIADVLSFYQERIANESYLRTATERRSIEQLANLVGYKLRPGLSSSVFLAFTVDDTANEVLIPAGTQAKSTPVPDSNATSQTFETSQDFIARPLWNEIRPRLTMPHDFRNPKVNSRIYFTGTGLNLNLNDRLAIQPAPDEAPVIRQIKHVREIPQRQLTVVELKPEVSHAGENLVRRAEEVLKRHFGKPPAGASAEENNGYNSIIDNFLTDRIAAARKVAQDGFATYGNVDQKINDEILVKGLLGNVFDNFIAPSGGPLKNATEEFSFNDGSIYSNIQQRYINKHLNLTKNISLPETSAEPDLVEVQKQLLSFAELGNKYFVVPLDSTPVNIQSGSKPFADIEHHYTGTTYSTIKIDVYCTDSLAKKENPDGTPSSVGLVDSEPRIPEENELIDKKGNLKYSILAWTDGANSTKDVVSQALSRITVGHPAAGTILVEILGTKSSVPKDKPTNSAEVQNLSWALFGSITRHVLPETTDGSTSNLEVSATPTKLKLHLSGADPNDHVTLEDTFPNLTISSKVKLKVVIQDPAKLDSDDSSTWSLNSHLNAETVQDFATPADLKSALAKLKISNMPKSNLSFVDINFNDESGARLGYARRIILTTNESVKIPALSHLNSALENSDLTELVSLIDLVKKFETATKSNNKLSAIVPKSTSLITNVNYRRFAQLEAEEDPKTLKEQLESKSITLDRKIKKILKDAGNDLEWPETFKLIEKQVGQYQETLLGAALDLDKVNEAANDVVSVLQGDVDHQIKRRLQAVFNALPIVTDDDKKFKSLVKNALKLDQNLGIENKTSELSKKIAALFDKPSEPLADQSARMISFINLLVSNVDRESWEFTKQGIELRTDLAPEDKEKIVSVFSSDLLDGQPSFTNLATKIHAYLNEKQKVERESSVHVILQSHNEFWRQKYLGRIHLKHSLKDQYERLGFKSNFVDAADKIDAHLNHKTLDKTELVKVLKESDVETAAEKASTFIRDLPSRRIIDAQESLDKIQDVFATVSRFNVRTDAIEDSRSRFKRLVVDLKIGGSTLGNIDVDALIQPGTSLFDQASSVLSATDQAAFFDQMRRFRLFGPSTLVQKPQISVFRSTAKLFGWNSPGNKESEQNGTKTTSSPETVIPLGFFDVPTAPNDRVIELDGEFKNTATGDYIVLSSESKKIENRVVGVAKVSTNPKTEFGISNNSTKLSLDQAWWDGDGFEVIQDTRIWCDPEILNLAEVHLDLEDPGESQHAEHKILSNGNTLELNDIHPELNVGSTIIIEGNHFEQDSAEIGTHLDRQLFKITSIRHIDQLRNGAFLYGDRIRTELTLNRPISSKLLRETVKVYANVVESTHGGLVSEVLGSGNGRISFQQFDVKDGPISRIPFANRHGLRDEIEVRVNNVRWDQTERLSSVKDDETMYELNSKLDQSTAIRFGDGETGARLPTGNENIRMSFRVGTGSEGNIQGDQIDQLPAPPYGVKAVRNPIRAEGGANKDTVYQSRMRSSLAAVSMQRLVSLDDYQNFALMYAGIDKAKTELRKGIVHVTIAGSSYEPLSPDSLLYRNLLQAFLTNGEPGIGIELHTHQMLLLFVSAGVKINSQFSWSMIEPEIRKRLLTTFGYGRAEFDKNVHSSDVISIVQSVPGVVYVDLDAFRRIGSDDLGRDPEFNEASPIVNSDSSAPKKREQSASVNSLSEIVVQKNNLCFLTPDIPNTLVLEQIR